LLSVKSPWQSESLLDDAFGGNAFGLALKIEDEPVPQRGKRPAVNIVLADVETPVEQRADFGAEDEGLSAARAGSAVRSYDVDAQSQLFRSEGRCREPQDHEFAAGIPVLLSRRPRTGRGRPADDGPGSGGRVSRAVTTVRDRWRMPPIQPAPDPMIRTSRRRRIRPLEQIPVCKSGGKQVPLAELADIKIEETPPNIEHEATNRRTYVKTNVHNRGVAGFVEEARRTIKERVDLSGLILHWGGEFEHLETASLRLAWITPLVLLFIFLLLYTSVRSMGLAVLIFLAVPMAASGGVFALALRGMYFSISAGVGFIALFGVAVLNGLVWVNGAEHLRAEGLNPHDASEKTAVVRLRPVMMTALVAALGFLPMALSTTPGSEIQRPLATVVIGGIITSTLLTTLVLPTIYPWFCPREAAVNE
jgi:hypothetical protein